MRLEDRLNSKIALLEDEDFKHQAVKAVVRSILGGGSVLRSALENKQITMADIIRAIKNKRCLRIPDQDLGATYLEQQVGTAIRDTIPIERINDIREIFGLHRLPPSELEKKAAPTRQPTA